MIENLSEREQRIITMLMENPQTTVSEISEILEVSQVTVRSDFQSLESRGLLIRTRGGALPSYHPEILEKMKNGTEIKKRIAKTAAGMINDGDTLMINDGTTTSMIPKYLLGKRDIRIVTNSTLIVPYARMNPSLHLTLVGGEFRISTEAIVGPAAIAGLEKFHVKHAFIGTGGFSAATGLTAQLTEGAEIARKMIELAEHVTVVADSGKYDMNGFVRITDLGKADTIISDTKLTKKAQDEIRGLGIELILVKQEK